MRRVELGELGLDRGGHLLIAHALSAVAPGESVAVDGDAPDLKVHLGAWCRARGHRYDAADGVVVRGEADVQRWHRAERTGAPDAVVDVAPARWGLAARGALIEAGSVEFAFPLSSAHEIWTEEAGRLYAQAVGAQWDPRSAIPWDAPIEHPEAIEDAIVQVMTYLVENETAALVISARFASQVHPHFREVMQLLAINAADEARHIEVFTRRALLRRTALGLSTSGGQASLATIVNEPDFVLASFLLSVLGEGTFLALLWFVHQHAPDPVTREIMRLTAQDEARHVAFGMAHLERHAREEPALLDRLAAAIERRHDALAHTAGLNAEVFDALVLLAAGAWSPEAIGAGWDRVQALVREMDEGRTKRLVRIGFTPARAAELSALHTRNFM